MNLRDMTPVERVLHRHMLRVERLTDSPPNGQTLQRIRNVAASALERAKILREESPERDTVPNPPLQQEPRPLRFHTTDDDSHPSFLRPPPGYELLHADFEQYRAYDQAMYGVEQRIGDSLDEGEEIPQAGLESSQSEQNSLRDSMPDSAFLQRLKTLEVQFNRFFDGELPGGQLREMRQQIKTLFDGKAGLPPFRQLHTLVGQTRETLNGLAGEVRQLENQTAENSMDLRQVCREHEVLARTVYGEMRDKVARVHGLAVTAIDGNRSLEKKLGALAEGSPTRYGYADLLKRVEQLEADHKADVEDSDANTVTLGRRIAELEDHRKADCGSLEGLHQRLKAVERGVATDGHVLSGVWQETQNRVEAVERLIEERIRLINEAFKGVQKQLSAGQERISTVKEQIEQLAVTVGLHTQQLSTEAQDGEDIMAGEDISDEEPRD